MKKIDMVGKVFNSLTVKEDVGRPKNGGYKWRCICECGNSVDVDGFRLRQGLTKSCGCLRELPGKKNFKHGRSSGNDKTYESWASARKRCNNPNHPAFHNYGGRGIKVCDEWSGKDGFSNFLRDMGERPEGTSLDRIDNNGNYTKENCRWSTPRLQNNNTRSNNYITYNGQTLTVAEWSREIGIKPSALLNRLEQLKWSIEKALTTPRRGDNKDWIDRYKHCYSRTREYGSLCNAKSRCHNPSNRDYKNYGGRGIKVCDRWGDKEKGYFYFIEDMGKCPEGMTLSRIDNDGDYTPENCCWATKEEQMNNTRKNKNISYKGLTLSISQWARRIGLGKETLRRRIFKDDWSIERSFTTPVPGKTINTI